jgi:hypothetical protein
MKIRTNRPIFTVITLAILIVFSFGTAQAQPDKVTGSGTPNKLAKWTSSSSIGDSGVTEDGSGNIGIGAAPLATAKILAQSALSGTSATLRVRNTGSGRAIEGSSNSGIGVNAFSGSGNALTANSLSGYGIFANSQSYVAISGNAANNDGIQGISNSADSAFAGIRGIGTAGGAYAGRFTGDVSVSGTLSKAGGSFKIDHPLDPENRYLYHSFVESPDMMNVYNGNVTTDENGEAVVELPAYFEALNKDFRYQLTAIGTFAQAIVAQKIKGNRFVIKTSVPQVEVSWQVTGIRQDGWANKHRIPVEEEKPERERGFYLHPEAFAQPEERGLEWARNPEMMRQMKEARERGAQKKP